MIKKSFLFVRIALLGWAMIMLSLLDSVAIETQGKAERPNNGEILMSNRIICSGQRKLAHDSKSLPDDEKLSNLWYNK